MHEFSICEALLREVERVASAHGASAVLALTIEAGPLSGVEPVLLEDAFSVARAGSIAAEATLTITQSPIRIRCRSCGDETTVGPNRLVCGSCGGIATDIIAGNELWLTSVELDTDDGDDHSGHVEAQASRTVEEVS